MVWWIAATVCAYFVKGLCGFANTLVFTTLLSFGNNNVNISPVDLLLGYPANAIMAFKERSRINLRVCAPLILLVLAGSVPGILFLKNADTGVVKIIFGLVIILVGADILLEERRPKKARQSKAALVFVGLLSGVLCGLFGVGALLSAYISRVTEDAAAFKANISAVFFAENTCRVALYAALGILTPDALKLAAVLLPFMLLGLIAGMLAGKKLDEKAAKRLVVVMLILSGAALVINSL